MAQVGTLSKDNYVPHTVTQMASPSRRTKPQCIHISKWIADPTVGLFLMKYIYLGQFCCSLPLGSAGICYVHLASTQFLEAVIIEDVSYPNSLLCYH